jgi:hypothetical protein
MDTYWATDANPNSSPFIDSIVCSNAVSDPGANCTANGLANPGTDPCANSSSFKTSIAAAHWFANRSTLTCPFTSSERVAYPVANRCTFPCADCDPFIRSHQLSD